MSTTSYHMSRSEPDPIMTDEKLLRRVIIGGVINLTTAMVIGLTLPSLMPSNTMAQPEYAYVMGLVLTLFPILAHLPQRRRLIRKGDLFSRMLSHVFHLYVPVLALTLFWATTNWMPSFF